MQHEASDNFGLLGGGHSGSDILVANVRRLIGGERQSARRDVYRGYCCCVRGAAADTLALNGAHERITLDPNQFLGPAKEAYQVAEKNPALLAQLHCYCGCDRIYGHQNLLDCYRGDHGSKCEICIGEAMMAQQLSEQGSPVDQIRDAIRRNYSGEK